MNRKVKVISQYHPAAALHSPSLWATLLNDWSELPEEVPHDFKVVPFGFTPANLVSLDTENAPDGSLGEWSIAYRNPEGQLCVSSTYGSRPNLTFDSTVIMQNARWDIRVLQRNGMKVPEKIVDTMIAAYCLGLGRQEAGDSGNKSGDNMVGGLGLKYLARRHLGMQMKTWEQVKDHPEWKEAYNADDSIATYLLWEKWLPKLPQHFYTIDMPLLNVLMAMEDRGILVDKDFLGQYSGILDQELAKFNLPLNPYSVPQLRKYIYEDLKVQPWKFTDTKAPSVDDDVLSTIDDPIIKQVINFKKLHQEKNTYAKNYQEQMDETGRIHCEFKQTSTATGRLSSSHPNLQNVTTEEHGSSLRKLFIAPPGKLLVDLDFEQIELRVFAALTGDEVMMDVFNKGGDIHQETADALKVSRSLGKKANFLMLYGGGDWKLSRELGISMEDAREGLKRYHHRFPAIAKYFAEQTAKIKETKEAFTFMGRRRRLDSMFAEDWRTQQEGIRQGINMPIQGTAGEVVKLAMIKLHYDYHAPMLLQVHDELLFEIEEKQAQEYAHWLQEYIPTITEVNGVKFPVSVKVGKNWSECH